MSHLLRDTGVPRDAEVRLTDSRVRLGIGQEIEEQGSSGAIAQERAKLN